MKKITVILPLHKIDKNYKLMLENSIKSLEGFKDDIVLFIVSDSTIKKEISKYNFYENLEVEFITHTLSTDFCNQINIAIDNCKTEWFSILEVDDEYKPIWLSSMYQHINSYPDVSVFLPIIKDINVDGKFISFTNESVWAYGFTDKQGLLDNETLLDFQNYQISGGLYKTNVIKENGLLKDNIKLTFGYELLLRLTHNGVKIMTVPRIGYQHVNFREDSLFWNYKNSSDSKLDENEVKFWIDTAKKEFFFKNKRDVNYVNS